MVAARTPPASERELEGDVMHFPDLPYRVPKYQSEVMEIRGLNLTDNAQAGDIADCRNLSSRRYPYFTTRRARAQLAEYSGVTAITAWEKLVAVKGTQLLYDGEAVGTVTAGAKQFAVVNTKLVIWPDKKYLDINTLTVGELAAELTGTGASFTTDTMTVSGWGDLTAQFHVGDTVSLEGCTAQADNNKSFLIKAITATTITAAENSFTEGTETGALTLARKIPDLDFICESENRLWGCSSADKTIYASALGDPTNFYTYEGISTDSYAVAVGTEGDFTGCASVSSSILFWKENVLHKMLGSYPAEYALYTYSIEGLQAGCSKSMQVINEVLYYKGLHGIYAYTGGTPSLVSERFGDHALSDAVAGTDGVRYYLSAADGTRRRLLVYDIQSGIWLEEDDTVAVDFARIGKDLYLLDSSGDIYLMDAGTEEAGIVWSMLFTPFYVSLQGRKRWRRLLLRVELPRASWLRAEVRFDGGRWQEAGRIVGAENDVQSIPLRIERCDKFELRLSGEGTCCVLGLSQEFSMGSER